MNKWGLIDKAGNIVIPLEYSRIDRPGDQDWENPGVDFIRVRIDNKYGFMDMEGKVIVPCEYNFLGPISDGLIIVQNAENAWVVYNESGGVVISVDKLERIGFGNDGVIDNEGNFLVPFGEFSQITNIGGGFFTARNDSGTGIISVIRE